MSEEMHRVRNNIQNPYLLLSLYLMIFMISVGEKDEWKNETFI